MTKEITKAFILQQMQDKFALRELTPEVFAFSETVVPIYNIEQHLEKWTGRFVDRTVNSITGVPFYLVPGDEKWTLWRYDVVFVSGVYTLAGAYTQRASDVAANFCYLDLGVAKTISYHIELSHPLVLMPGDQFFIAVDGYTSSGTLRVYVDYMKEELR